MSAYLKYATGKEIKRVACGSVTTIGRDRSNTIVLTELQLSRNHAMVRRLGNGDYYLIDSGSSNGSQVNGKRITSPTLLHDGDRITLGASEFHFEQEARSASLKDSLSLQETMLVHTPQIREITILVADIRGFTTLSERQPIQTLTRVMNAWFEQVSACIEVNRGTLDKFIGDCVFARWEGEDACANVFAALRTACQVRAITAALHVSFPELGEPLHIGAGINTGLASLGIGSENTALGDAVNTAFRLESATKQLGVDIVLSESAYRCLPPRYQHDATRSLRLKGKEKAVSVLGLDFSSVESLLQSLDANKKGQPL